MIHCQTHLPFPVPPWYLHRKHIPSVTWTFLPKLRMNTSSRTAQRVSNESQGWPVRWIHSAKKEQPYASDKPLQLFPRPLCQQFVHFYFSTPEPLCYSKHEKGSLYWESPKTWLVVLPNVSSYEPFQSAALCGSFLRRGRTSPLSIAANRDSHTWFLVFGHLTRTEQMWHWSQLCSKQQVGTPETLPAYISPWFCASPAVVVSELSWRQPLRFW